MTQVLRPKQWIEDPEEEVLYSGYLSSLMKVGLREDWKEHWKKEGLEDPDYMKKLDELPEGYS